MTFLIIVFVVIALFFAFRLGSKTGETIGSSQSQGGMKVKYQVLLDNILSGRDDAKIFVCTRTYVKAGVSTYGGNTFFHIQQCPGGKVMIDYEISNNPVFPDHTIRKVFPDDMDQNKMFEELAVEVEKFMKSRMGG